MRRPPRSTRTDPRFPDTTRFPAFAHVGSCLCRLNPVPRRRRAEECLPAAGEVRSQCRVTCPERRPRRACASPRRSEEHTSELQSLMRISYAVFCLKKKNNSLSFTIMYKFCIIITILNTIYILYIY